MRDSTTSAAPRPKPNPNVQLPKRNVQLPKRSATRKPLAMKAQNPTAVIRSARQKTRPTFDHWGLFVSFMGNKGLRGNVGETPLDYATYPDHRAPLAVLATADLLRHHDSKTGKELKAEGK